ncbi:uncharacterized protein LOC126880552 [Diabrotica virgifera virgifera]|uniref:Uncharacterized protein LOC114345018 n=1 Tax=Diabrotica virgifera virgifera TaxID=50390 RepID=A0A6P7GPV9_DIAVI|nr:uncharacterized protein LOC126880552 [Diabrotica virgifera virgifera]
MTSKRTVLSRPRTKLYDANYNIGESYYKGALDRLDRKYSGRSLSPPRQPSPVAESIAERHARIFADEDLEYSRRRAEKHIREENAFDARTARFNRASALLADSMDNDISDETATSIRRLRANKKVSIIDDADLENTSNNLKSMRLLDRSDKILDSVGINDSLPRKMAEKDVAQRRSALKMSYRPEEDSLTKWTPLENNITSYRARREEVTASIESDSGASRRAKLSKDRLNDLEEEMVAMQEKQAAREARVARLRKLVAETEQDSASFELSQAKAERAESRKERLAVEY